MKLTPKQQEMIDYIRSYINANGIAPNTTEAALHFDKSRQACVDLMNKLNEIGAIQFNRYGVRTMKIGDMEPVLVNIKSPVIDTTRVKALPSVVRLCETETPEVAFKSKWLRMPLRA